MAGHATNVVAPTELVQVDFHFSCDRLEESCGTGYWRNGWTGTDNPPIVKLVKAGRLMADPKEAIRNAIQAARQSGVSSGEIIKIVEEEFDKTDETLSAGKKPLTGEDAVWNPLTEDLKKSK